MAIAAGALFSRVEDRVLREGGFNLQQLSFPLSPFPRPSAAPLAVAWEVIQADAGLQQKLQGVTEPDAVAAIAKEAGFSISAEEMKKAQSEFELTDEQMEQVTGGRRYHFTDSVPDPVPTRYANKVTSQFCGCCRAA